MPAQRLTVRLVAATPNAEGLAALGARLCYSASDLTTLEENIAQKDQQVFIEQLLATGHHSVLEHATFTFAVEGVSRALLAQLTRHRIASFSVQSQRYVSQTKGFDYIIPPAIEQLGAAAVAEYDAQMAQMLAWYEGWREKLGGKGEKVNEDARFVLPMASGTRLLVTMNARELLHFFKMRCCRRAQWEIRALAKEILLIACKEAPTFFASAGPACLSGACPEGKRTCGHTVEVRKEYSMIGKG